MVNFAQIRFNRLSDVNLGRSSNHDLLMTAESGCAPGQPLVKRAKFALRAPPDRFLGFERPMGSGTCRLLLESGQVTQLR
jgi:hypothetical protein